MKKNKKRYRTYKIIKIVRDDKFYWMPLYKDKSTNKQWVTLGLWVHGTNYLVPAEYEYKFSALRRIVLDMNFMKRSNKFEIFEEIKVGKIKLD